MRALFTTDFLISVLLASFTIILLFSALLMQMNSISLQLGMAERDRDAILLADFLVNACEDEGGLAVCGSESGELSERAIRKFDENLLDTLEGKLGINIGEIQVSWLDGNELLSLNSGDENGSICAKRLGILGSRAVIIRACVPWS